MTAAPARIYYPYGVLIDSIGSAVSTLRALLTDAATLTAQARRAPDRHALLCLAGAHVHLVGRYLESLEHVDPTGHAELLHTYRRVSSLHEVAHL